jgi:nucleotide-binding universal stress UspA family protein
MFKKILVAYDGSKGADRALTLAIQLAREQEAALWALTVADHLPRYPATIDETDETLRTLERTLTRLQHKVRMLASEEGVTVQTITRIGHAGQAIVEAATDGGFDLLVLGRSGHSEVWGRFMGSTPDKVSRHAPCSVLIVH